VNTNRVVRHFDDLELIGRKCGIVTLFSGGLDSSFLLHWLASKAGGRVTALTIDLGDHIDREELRRVAAKFGADSVVIDGRSNFIKDAVIPAVNANAKYMAVYPVSASLSRPIMAELAVKFARSNGFGAIVHTANQSQNSLRRLNGALAALGFEGYFGTPYEYSAYSRTEKIAQLRNAGHASFFDRKTSADSNLWCREFETGALDNPENFEVSENLFHWSRKPQDDLQESELTISYANGIPVALNGDCHPTQTLIETLNRLVGAYGLGRYAGLEHLEGGERVLEVREAPAAYILMDAYRHLETAILDTELLREKISLEQVWVREAVEGRWFGQLREAANAFIAYSAKLVSGDVTYVLGRGSSVVRGIRSKAGRYIVDRDSWEEKASRAREQRRIQGNENGSQLNVTQ
jgi:argininosuccinate synthase